MGKNTRILFFIIIEFSMSFKETVGRNRKDETVKIKQLTDENEKKCFAFIMLMLCTQLLLLFVMIQKNENFALIFHLINDDIKGNCGAYCVRPLQHLMIMDGKGREK